MADQITREKVRALLDGDLTFQERVEATNRLDQKALVSRLTLPREISRFHQVEWATLCERWGMRLLGNANADSLAVEMPDGWLLRPAAQGSLWNLLLDGRGRQRASIFYRSMGSNATMYLDSRYSLFSHYYDPTDHTVRIISAADGQRIFHEFGRVPLHYPGYFSEVERIEQLGREWLDHEFPNWRDPFAYWDLEP